MFKLNVFCFFSDTPGHGSGWAESPCTDLGGDLIQDTPTPGTSKRISRRDETTMSGGTSRTMTLSTDEDLETMGYKVNLPIHNFTGLRRINNLNSGSRY